MRGAWGHAGPGGAQDRRVELARTRRLLRAALVAAQLATIGATWPLWSATRALPVLPPIVWLGAVPFGGALVLSSLAALEGSRRAWALHVAVLGLSLLGDAQRLQPAPLSIAFLLGTCTRARGLDTRAIGAHLAAAWLAAGAAKLSGVFADEVAPFFADTWAGPLAPFTPWIELGLGLGVLAPGSRGSAAVLGALLHLGVAATLVALDHNRGVWAWNVGLACAALALAWSHRRAQTGSSSALAALALLWPLLYPLGLAAPSTALFVYGGLEPVTLACDRFERCTIDREQRHTLAQLGVPIPGDVALLHASFQASCAPGDRWLARRRGGDEAVLARARCGEPLTDETEGTDR